MANAVPAQIVQAGLGLLLLVTEVGCATKSEINKLTLGLNSKLDTMNSSLSSDVQELRAEVTSVRAAQQELEKGLAQTLEAVRADTKAAVEKMAAADKAKLEVLQGLRSDTRRTRQVVVDYAGTSNQALEKIAAATGEINRELRDIRRAMATIENLPPLVSGVGEEVRSLKDAMLQSYRLEEIILRDRLRALEQLSTQLKPVAARGQAEPVGGN